jgi:NAD(P)-dependent dehydrogenase (short-subunit alcohol dehydrogenase family)
MNNHPVVLITGALTGIGRATALAFAQEGSRVVISGRRDDAGQALVTELRALGAEAEFVHADVRHEDDVRNLVDQTVERFGRLDVVVNNAGSEGKPGPLTEQSAETYAATFDTNVLGTILSLKHEMRVMLAQRHGNIVNLSSTFGSRGAAGASMYVASKHAGRRPDESGRARRCRSGRARQRGRAGPCGDRNAEPLYGQCRPESQPGRRRARETSWKGSRDRSGDRVSRV